MSYDIVLTLGTIVGAGLITWGAMKAGATYASKEIERLHRIVALHIQADFDAAIGTEKRMTRVETLLGEIHRAVVDK